MQNWEIAISVLSLCTAISLFSQNNRRLLTARDTRIPGWILTFIVVIYIGTRPPWCYSDSISYSEIFMLCQNGIWETLPGKKSEWLWTLIEQFFITFGTRQGWFIAIAAIYVGGLAYFVRRSLPGHFWLGMIFVITSFSFFSYGTNGIRQGAATSVALAALPLIVNPNTGKLYRNILRLAVGVTILYLSTAFHYSVTAIFAGAIVAVYARNLKMNIAVWFFCIVLGFFFSDFFMNMMGGITDDYRVEYYGSMGDDADYGEARFRWDFILYSFFPIAEGIYVEARKLCDDRYYKWLLNTYIVVNAFWVLINNIAYSNRIAYLSWVMYPLLVLYPFVRFRLFRGQSTVLAILLVAFTVFTIFVGIGV